MPTLGGERRAPPARAYPSALGSAFDKSSFTRVLTILALLFVAKNVLFKDYRQATIASLKEAGQSDTEIARLVPRTAAEQKKYVEDKKVDYQKLKKDVAYLLAEVAALKEQQRQKNTDNHTITTTIDRSDKTSSVDNSSESEPQNEQLVQTG